MRATTLFSLLVASVIATGCGGAEPAAPEAQAPTQEQEQTGSARVQALTAGSPVTSRPYKFKVPKGYDASKPTPLLIMLHGLTASGELEELLLHFGPLADKQNFLYAYPDGTKNPLGVRFWNATDFCCNFFGSEVDDVAYINAVIDDMASHYNVDAKRVFVTGHSNGGFMAHRMACDSSARIAGIVSLAGAQWNDATKCRPTDKVAVAQVHGNLDLIVAYGGGPLYPSAHETVDIWANRNGCLGRLTYGGTNLDLDGVLLGAETKVERYTGCTEPGAVELWTMQAAGHVPAFNSYWPGAVWAFLMAHPKP